MTPVVFAGGMICADKDTGDILWMRDCCPACGHDKMVPIRKDIPPVCLAWKRCLKCQTEWRTQ